MPASICTGGSFAGRICATPSGSEVRFDNSKLAQAEQVVAEVSRQLDITEHTLAREAKFTQPILPDVVEEYLRLEALALECWSA